MSQTKKKIAVFFGGRSPEHDVSIVTGLQILHAIDESLYDAFPVYVTIEGEWLVGDVLRERGNYLLSKDALRHVQTVTLNVKPGRPSLLSQKQGLFQKTEIIEFDAAIPAFHGLYGEDGNAQGLFEFAGIPYTGMRTMGSSILMDKGATKKVLQSAGIPMLPYVIIKRPSEGLLIAEETLVEIMGDLKFPCIVKPSHLGSSIGVAKAENMEDLRSALPVIFEFDDAAILEPFVENLVEYNVSVSKAFDGKVMTSAIERPKAQDELLDFKQKYLSGGDDKSGNKLGQKSSAPPSEGMLSLTRELNPKIDSKMEKDIQRWAADMFNTIDGTGAPRIDFIGNSKTGELWLNEVNPWPGSIGYFLWEAAKEPILFTDLLSALIEEAFLEKKNRKLPKDPVPKDARLFKRGA